MEITNENKLIINRLSRAEGQIRALGESLEAGTVTDCKAFISQIKAARSALKHAGEQYVLLHIKKCHSYPAKKRDEQIAEAISVLASD